MQKSDYDKAISLVPKDILAFMSRGRLWMLKREYNKALEDFNSALYINPKNLDALECRSDLFKELNEDEKALQGYNEAIDLFPKTSLLLSRAYLYKKMKKFDEGIVDLFKVIDLQKEFPTADPYICLASIYRLAGDINAAFDAINTIPEKEDNLGDYYCTMAEIYSTINQDDKFFENIEIAFKNHLSIERIDTDVKEKYEKGQQFIDFG